MISDSEIKELESTLCPCPCCGGKAHINISKYGGGSGYVACDNTLGCGLTNGLADDVRIAVARWNRRAA